MERDMVSSFKFTLGRADDLFGCLLATFSAVFSVAGANPKLVRIRDAPGQFPTLDKFHSRSLDFISATD